MVLKWSQEHFRLNNYIGACFGISRNLTEAKWELKVNKNAASFAAYATEYTNYPLKLMVPTSTTLSTLYLVTDLKDLDILVAVKKYILFIPIFSVKRQ